MTDCQYCGTDEAKCRRHGCPVCCGCQRRLEDECDSPECRHPLHRATSSPAPDALDQPGATDEPDANGHVKTAWMACYNCGAKTNDDAFREPCPRSPAKYDVLDAQRERDEALRERDEARRTAYNPRICGAILENSAVCSMPPAHEPPHRGHLATGGRVAWWGNDPPLDAVTLIRDRNLLTAQLADMRTRAERAEARCAALGTDPSVLMERPSVLAEAMRRLGEAEAARDRLATLAEEEEALREAEHSLLLDARSERDVARRERDAMRSERDDVRRLAERLLSERDQLTNKLAEAQEVWAAWQKTGAQDPTATVILLTRLASLFPPEKP